MKNLLNFLLALYILILAKQGFASSSLAVNEEKEEVDTFVAVLSCSDSEKIEINFKKIFRSLLHNQLSALSLQHNSSKIILRTNKAEQLNVLRDVHLQNPEFEFFTGEEAIEQIDKVSLENV